MKKFIYLNGVKLGHLKITEYLYFTKQVASHIEATGVEALHIDETKFQTFKDLINRLTDLVAQSRITDETAKINETAQKLIALVVYLLNTIKSETTLPISSRKEAGITLANLTKRYLKVARLPQRQLISSVEALLVDLAKEEAAPHVTTLGLADIVAQISSTVAQLSILMDSRTVKQVQFRNASMLPIRKELTALFEEFRTTVYCFSVTAPSDALTEFIDYLDKLIGDSITAYNLRTGRSGNTKTEDSVTTEPKEESSAETA